MDERAKRILWSIKKKAQGCCLEARTIAFPQREHPSATRMPDICALVTLPSCQNSELRRIRGCPTHQICPSYARIFRVNLTSVRRHRHRFRAAVYCGRERKAKNQPLHVQTGMRVDMTLMHDQSQWRMPFIGAAIRHVQQWGSSFKQSALRYVRFAIQHGIIVLPRGFRRLNTFLSISCAGLHLHRPYLANFGQAAERCLRRLIQWP